LSRIVPHIRRSWVVDQKNDSRKIASGEWIIFRSPRFFPAYLRHVLVSNDFHARFMQTVAGVGGSLLRARPEGVKEIDIPLPPLEEQKRIAAILDQADSLRRLRQRAIDRLNMLGQAIFYEMFGDPSTNSMSWVERPFGDLISGSLRNGLSSSKTGQVEGEVLTLSAITRGQFDFTARKSALFDRRPSNSQLLSTDTFLICRGNGNKSLVGKGIFPDRSTTEVCFPDTMIGVEIDTKVLSPKYLESVWRDTCVRRQLESGARTTNGAHKVNQQLLSSIIIPVPPIALQRCFGEAIEATDHQSAKLHSQQTGLHALFSSLQHRAFRGEL
jgi:type I restriction enzyme S subunit